MIYPESFIQDRALAVISRQTNKIQYIQPIQPQSATGFVAEIYAQIQAGFAIVPPFSLHSPVAEVLAAVWVLTAETLTVTGVKRAHKEAVALAVSHINACSYCVDAHTMMLHGATDDQAAYALRSGRFEDIKDEQERAFAAWASATRTPCSPLLVAPPFTRAEAPEVVGTAVAFHYMNRMANVFLDKSPIPLPSVVRDMRGMMHLSGKIIGKAIVRKSTRPGHMLHLLPEAPPLADLHWALPNPYVSDALARFHATIEQVGCEVLSEPVRTMTTRYLEQWRGEGAGISCQWAEDMIKGLSEPDKAAARLVLLTALASYQVDGYVVSAFRKHYPDDASLVKATAWASWQAAYRVGSWLHLPRG